MKLNIRLFHRCDLSNATLQNKLLAVSGDARLLKDLRTGRLEIRGGTLRDQARLRVWQREFLTEPQLPPPYRSWSGRLHA